MSLSPIANVISAPSERSHIPSILPRRPPQGSRDKSDVRFHALSQIAQLTHALRCVGRLSKAAPTAEPFRPLATVLFFGRMGRPKAESVPDAWHCLRPCRPRAGGRMDAGRVPGGITITSDDPAPCRGRLTLLPAWAASSEGMRCDDEAAILASLGCIGSFAARPGLALCIWLRRRHGLALVGYPTRPDRVQK